ncbi:hypothetical protein [Pontibacter sp. G13]|uniref:hypothetical protein n=1 Tax=Pontibacter sp. G13 TaxID=3074898 RepID=UPI00288C3280|nr:hypothetical protein [Pontibacter sp. G13]WNJ19286.1 hypothetical protein RJD25_02240 [Pontibacter sp. G13]
MELANFTQALLQHHEITLPESVPSQEEGDDLRALAHLHAAWQQDQKRLPGPIPDFEPQSALWGVRMVLHAAYALLHREVSENQVKEWLSVPLPNHSHSALHSADLAFRYIGNVATRSQILASADILTQTIRELANITCLSAPFVPASNPDISPVLAHQTLRYLYIDRVVETRRLDLARHPELTPLLLQRLGLHADSYWPNIIQLLKHDPDYLPDPT